MQSFDDRAGRGARRPESTSPSTDASYDVLFHVFGRDTSDAADAITVRASAGCPDLEEHGARAHLAMLRRSDDGSIAILDPAGVVVCWYARAGDRARRESPVLGRHVAQFYAASDAADGLPQRHLRSASVFGRSTRHGWRVSAAGGRFWGVTDIRTILQHDGGLAGFVHVIRPISDSREPVRVRPPRAWLPAGVFAVPAYASAAVAA